MGLKIVKGKQRSPLRAVVYGVEGIGKTTLVSQFPKPLILDTEDGSTHLDVDRVACRSLTSLEGAMHTLVRDNEGYKTVVIDSADWAERSAQEHILSKANKRSIEDFGFGKGYVMLAEQIARLLAIADQLVAAGLNVVFVAHSKVVRVSPPDETDGYDRWELKLHKQVAPLFKEWADLVLFCNYHTKLIEGEDGRTKGRGGKERLMYAQRTAAFDAKNRFGLPESMPMGIEPLAGLFSDAPAAKREAATKPEPPLFDRIADYIGKAASVRTLGTIGDKIDGYVSSGELTEVQAQLLRDAVNERHNELEPQEVTDGVA